VVNLICLISLVGELSPVHAVYSPSKPGSPCLSQCLGKSGGPCKSIGPKKSDCLGKSAGHVQHKSRLNVQGSHCHRDKMLQWTFQVGQNVTVDVVNLDGSSRHLLGLVSNYSRCLITY
jgi:hypothetical protein